MQEGGQKKYRCPKAVGQEKTYAVTPLNKVGDANEQLGNRQCKNDRDHPNNEFKNVHRYSSPLTERFMFLSIERRFLGLVIRVLTIRTPMLGI